MFIVQRHRKVISINSAVTNASIAHSIGTISSDAQNSLAQQFMDRVIGLEGLN